MRNQYIFGSLVAFTLLLAGCGGQQQHHHDHATSHVHTAPHGGVLVELGDHLYNLEFLFNPATGRLQAWVLDGHAENFVRSSMSSFEVVITTAGGPRPVVMLPVANPATGEPVGDTSQFEAEVPWLAAIGAFTAEIPGVTVRGTQFENVALVYPPPGS